MRTNLKARSTTRSFAFNLALVAVLIACTSVARTARADAQLTLAQVLNDLPGSPQLQKSESLFEESSWRRVGSYAGFLPSVVVGANRLLDKNYMLIDVSLNGGPPLTIPQIMPTTNYTLTVNWTLFDGFANFEHWRSAKALERSAHSELEWARFQSQRQLILMYYRALASKTLRQVAEQNAKALDDHLNDTKLFKRAGLSTNFDLLRVEVQLSEAESEVANAKDNEMLSVLRLGDVTNQNYIGHDVTGNLPALDPKVIESVTLSDVGRKDLEAMAERVEGMDENASAAAKHWVPKVGLYAEYQRYNNRGDAWNDDTEFRDARAIGLQLTWPLFEGFSATARSHEAVEQRHQAELTLAQARAKSRTDLEFWKRKYTYFSTFARTRQGDVAKSTESVRLAREGRKVGSRTNTDLLDAESELFRARAGLVNAQIGAIEALINLELATGKPLYRFE